MLWTFIYMDTNAVFGTYSVPLFTTVVNKACAELDS